MASTIIDALLPSQPRPSAGDSTSRGDGGPPFGPVLSQALQSDDSRTAPSPAEAQSRPSTDDGLHLDHHSDDDHAELDAGSDATRGDSEAEAAVPERDEDDEVEISEEASAADDTTAAEAAAAAQSQPATNGQEVTAESEADAAAQEVAAIEEAAKGGADEQAASEAQAPAQNGATTDDGSEAPTALKEFGDVLSASSKAAAKSAQAEGTDGKATRKTEKSKALEGKPTKAAMHAATEEDAAAEGDAATEAEGADSTQVSPSNRTPGSDRAKSATDDVGSQPSKHGAGRNDNQPAAQPAATTTIAAIDATSATQSAGDDAAPTPSPSDGAAQNSAIGAVETTASPRGAASFARLTAERSIRPAAANADDGPGGFDRARFVGRVEGAIRAAHQRDGRVQVRLSPPELGSLRIELTMHQGSLSARVEAETTAARKVLLDNLPALRERLEQQGMRVERFDVDVRQEGGNSGGSAQQGADERAARQAADDRRPALRRESSIQQTAKSARITRTSGAASDAGLDVLV